MAHGYAILVIWKDGEEEYVKAGLGPVPALFGGKKEARRQVEFLKIGMEGDCQSINVVKYPAKKDWV